MRSGLIILILLISTPCWGASVLENFHGFESQSTLDIDQTAGSPAFNTTTKKSGTASLELAGAATIAEAGLRPIFDSGGVPTFSTTTPYTTFGFHVYFSDKTPSGDTTFLEIQQGANIHFSLAIQADSDLLLIGNSATLDTITDPFTEAQWHYLEVKLFINGSTGSAEVFIDGSSAATASTGDTQGSTSDISYIQFLGPGSGDGTYYFDNFYILIDDADTTLPTPLANNSDGLEVFAYQQGKTTNTADSGYTTNDTTLASGNWDDCGQNPWVNTSQCDYNGASSPADGAVVFDDTASQGRGPGPSGGAYTVSGTIKGGKWSGLFDRYTGGATTWTMWYGSNNDTPLSNISLTDPDGDVLRAIVKEDASVPTSSETFGLGFGYSGAKEIVADTIMAEILHLPAVGGAAYTNVMHVM